MFNPDTNGMLITGAEFGAASVANRTNIQELGNRARKSNYVATVDPATTDNETTGYRAGSRWINTTSNQLFECVFANSSTATWVNNTGSSTVNGSAVNIGDNFSDFFDITHALGTRDVIVQIYRNSTPYDEIYPEVQRLTVNSVRIIFGVGHSPSADQYRVLIRKIA